eukprot:TRINITY_DN2383_c0_g1_i13.p1 TRINITY_DN2383_c0_g1~~TRINITY_DN2383_c0_g1_i13.p1  ORF type:complete len:750 (-),score=93.88 TRINITY_DN2383_c0_g1_i13:114-2363(-)
MTILFYKESLPQLIDQTQQNNEFNNNQNVETYMKFGKYLSSKVRPEWREQYVDYRALKDNIKEQVRASEQVGAVLSHSPRQTSLSVLKPTDKDATEELAVKFFRLLEKEIDKVGKFTKRQVQQLRQDLQTLSRRVDTIEGRSEFGDVQIVRENLIIEAKRIGDEYLHLEKYVNLNYLAFHKILKKHDKQLPHAPCRQFYTPHLHHQPWVQGGYSDLLVHLSNVHSRLRGDTSGNKNEDAAQGFVRSTTKYWVTTTDVSSVKHIVLQNLPVFQFEKDQFDGDAQLINSVYLDNSSMELYHSRLDKRPGALAIRLRWYGNDGPKLVFVERKTHKESWKGEESVKERFVLQPEKVVPFLEGEYTLECAQSDLRAKGKSESEIQKFSRLFQEVQQVVDSKQLRPMVRTQYMRAAFQIPFDATVRVSLDTNLTMIKENPEDGPSCTLAGRWYRDPLVPITRSEITRFPHAVLEVKLSLPEGTAAPLWVRDLLSSGLLTEVHKFSKFIHGSATLMPDMVQAVPYWIDDQSIRESIMDSAPLQRLKVEIPEGNNENFLTIDNEYDLRHPLLGDKPTMNLLAESKQAPHARRTFRQAPNGAARFVERMMNKMVMEKKRGQVVESDQVVMRIEPKTFFANERTFLSWLHMAITVGSIAAALLGFSASTAQDKQFGMESHHLVEVICMILLPVAVLMTIYALVTFLWRGRRIQRKEADVIDDRVGPLVLALVVVAALTAILILSILDLVDSIQQADRTS